MLVIGLRDRQRVTIEHAGETLVVVVCGIKPLPLDVSLGDPQPPLRLGFDGPMTFKIVRNNAKTKVPQDQQIDAGAVRPRDFR